eukprot:Nitzschia sp. Nitz4//scaffold85_size83877//30632//32860//NITZ4_005225-RA/size83877-augustus-gene-0.149-mRNA-1//1//CDS//3329559125//8912//frame0
MLVRLTSRSFLSKAFIRPCPISSNISKTALKSQQVMSFHFASSEYASCFQNLPVPDVPKIRKSAIDYIDNFDAQSWYTDPIVSLLKGQSLGGGHVVDTVNALGVVNGKQVYATSDQISALKEHIQTFQSPSKDYREAIRKVEQAFLNEYAGFLVGNQCIDFEKQDGVTEIEESIMANHVERNLNDILLREEQAGRIAVNRKPIYISCVSNFSNFLDLFRKTLRSLEVGIPCVVLGRSNTVQHSYRWTKLLMDLAIQEGIDPGMVTYLSCPLEDIKDITQGLQEHTGNLYSTCSRELAANIKSGYPNTIASTGGPNTLIAMDWTEAIQDAIRMSATIESSGQCTALRHAIVPPSVTKDQVLEMIGKCQSTPSAAESLKCSGFDSIFAHHKGSPPGPSGNGYQRHDSVDASYRVSEQLPPNGIEEHWRKVVVDVSKVNTEDHLTEIANWLNTNQPISMAVNGKTKEQSMEIGFALWSSTGLVVNTIGTPESPAMTCQARPQEGEVFGEFPPRRDLTKYTKFPVVVPSSTPGYDSSYTADYLKDQASKVLSGSVGSFVKDIADEQVRGYTVTLFEYLEDATRENPKRGFGTSRTAMWGLQRPPLQTKTYLECNTTFDDLAPSLMPFFATNAKGQVVVVTDNSAISQLCKKHGIATQKSITEDSLSPGDNSKTISGKMETYVMVGHFLATMLPVGHIKSTAPNDEEFIKQVRALEKWLQVNPNA